METSAPLLTVGRHIRVIADCVVQARELTREFITEISWHPNLPDRAEEVLADPDTWEALPHQMALREAILADPVLFGCVAHARVLEEIEFDTLALRRLGDFPDEMIHDVLWEAAARLAPDSRSFFAVMDDTVFIDYLDPLLENFTISLDAVAITRDEADPPPSPESRHHRVTFDLTFRAYEPRGERLIERFEWSRFQTMSGSAFRRAIPHLQALYHASVADPVLLRRLIQDLVFAEIESVSDTIWTRVGVPMEYDFDVFRNVLPRLPAESEAYFRDVIRREQETEETSFFDQTSILSDSFQFAAEAVALAIEDEPNPAIDWQFAPRRRQSGE